MIISCAFVSRELARILEMREPIAMLSALVLACHDNPRSEWMVEEVARNYLASHD